MMDDELEYMDHKDESVRERVSPSTSIHSQQMNSSPIAVYPIDSSQWLTHLDVPLPSS